MRSLAGALAGLGLLALPAIPSPTYLATSAATDTWSLQAADSAAIAVSATRFGSDAWSLATTESGSVTTDAAVSGSDTWSASLSQASVIRQYPSEKTRLGLLALPGIYSVITEKISTQSIPGSDSWSLAYSLETASRSVSGVIAAADTWSTAVIEASGLATYPAEKTQLSLLSLVGKYIAISAKPGAAGQGIAASDLWSLTWTEDPTDTVFTQTTDIWSLRFTEASSLAVSQTFGGADSWSLNWLDIASVSAGGPVLQSVSDTWPVLLFDTTGVAATVDAADTWSISIADSSAIDVSTDSKDGTDSWDLSFALETAFFSQVVDIPILGSDEWGVLFEGSSGLIRPTIDVSPRRLTLIVRASRNTDV